jgi:hypothetical protein
LKFKIENWGNRKAVVQDALAKDQFSQQYAVLSTPRLRDDKYSLHFETKSFGGFSENLVSSAGFYLYPLTLISEIYLQPADYHYFNNEIEIDSIKKRSNFLYQISAHVNSSKGIFQLSQSFDHGWLALAIPTGSDRNLRDCQLLNHFGYNGWSNAWLINHGSWVVLVFFWPQFLVFIGYSFLLLYIIILAGVLLKLRLKDAV